MTTFLCDGDADKRERRMCSIFYTSRLILIEQSRLMNEAAFSAFLEFD
jgi:hypothetical protein